MNNNNILSKNSINLESLEKQLEGKLFYDHTVRLLYATDASAYKEMPLAVAVPKTKEDIQKIIRSLVKKDIGVLITDHNVQQTLAITNKTYIMFEGNILKEGIPEDLANDPDVRRAYLGENFRFEKF